MATTSAILMSTAEIGTNPEETLGSREPLMQTAKVDLTRTKRTIFSGIIPMPNDMHLHHPEGLGGM